MPASALGVLGRYDLILDCTDHPTSRYLISDAAVLASKPVISAGALRTDGVLNCLNFPRPTASDPLNRGPCYRCIFPTPPLPETVVPCGEGGVLGPAVGVMGVLMALEAIKMVSMGQHHPGYLPPENLANSECTSGATTHSMLLFSALSEPQFRVARLRGKRPSCPSCSAHPTITTESLTSGSLDYVQFCGIATVPQLADEHRISAEELSTLFGARRGSRYERRQKGEIKEAFQDDNANDVGDNIMLLDVRPRPQFALCSLSGSVNIPLPDLMGAADQDELQELFRRKGAPAAMPSQNIVAICRLGNDSQVAVTRLRELMVANTDEEQAKSIRGKSTANRSRIRDVRGGFKAWRTQVDSCWPEY